MFNEYIENFISLDECTELINFGLSCNLIDMQSTSFDNGGNPLKNHNSNFLKRKGYYFTNKEKHQKTIKNLSSKIIEISNKLSPFKSTLYTACDKYTFNKYGSGDFLKWHSDMQEIKNSGTITIILQLNDDYIGGDIKYKINDIEYVVPKKAGSIFVFDCNVPHMIEEVESGNRYSINTWPSHKKITTII